MNLANNNKAGSGFHNQPKNSKINLRVANKFLAILFCLLLITLVGVINDISVKNIIKQKLEKDYADLLKDTEQIELKVMALESYDQIDKKARDLKLVKVEKIDYVNADQSVAKK